MVNGTLKGKGLALGAEPPRIKIRFVEYPQPPPPPPPQPLAADVRRIKTPLLKLPISLWSTLQVKEIFGAGTACVVCPVNRILYEGQVRKAKTKKGW